MPLTRWQTPTLRHDVDDEGEIAWVELFFDLIYVAALIQLGNALSDDVSWAGVLRFVGVFALLWWTWTGTTALMNRFAADDVPHRLLVFAQMLTVGNLALVAVSPIGDRSAWFALAYVAARLPLLLMYLRVRRRIAAADELAALYLRVFGASAVVWLLSLLLPTPARFVVWGLAVAAEFVAPVLGVRRLDAPPTHEEHFRERFAVFTIVVLGESFVKTLGELAEVGVSVATQVLGGLAFGVAAAGWWAYFDDVADSTLRRDGGDLGMRRIIWVYGHLPLAAGITALGVASKKAVTAGGLDATLDPAYAWLLAGSLAVALLATAVLDVVTASPHFAVGARTRVGPRVVAAVAVLLAAPLLLRSPVLTLLAVVAAVAVAQIGAEVLVAARADRRISREVDQLVAERTGWCDDLVAATPQQPATRGCTACEELGRAWVQLRVCLACGHVGCCDDSPGAHGTAHARAVGHPVLATLEPGDDWAYCDDHDVTATSWREDVVSPGGR